MRLLTALALAAALSTGPAAFAANTMTPAPAAKPAPAVKPAAASPKPTLSADKAAISKACSDQADAKKLTGKARKHFRGKCKTAGKG